MKRAVLHLVGRCHEIVQGMSPHLREALSLVAMLASGVGVLVMVLGGRLGAALVGTLVFGAQVWIHLDGFCGIRLRRPSWLRRRAPIRIRQRPH